MPQKELQYLKFVLETGFAMVKETNNYHNWFPAISFYDKKGEIQLYIPEKVLLEFYNALRFVANHPGIMKICEINDRQTYFNLVQKDNHLFIIPRDFEDDFKKAVCIIDQYNAEELIKAINRFGAV